MTIVKYLLSTGVCTTAELLAYRKEDKDGYDKLIAMAQEQARNQNIVIEESPKQ